MQDPSNLFTVALGLRSPWEVSDVRFEPEAGEIHFEVACTARRLSCPACGADEQPVHDSRKRSWQHLHFFQYRAYLHAQVPRVRCGKCGKTSQVVVPWARPRSGFTLLFEALVVTLSQRMPVRQVAALLGVNPGRLWQALGALVEGAREQESFEGVRRIGVDEKHVGRLGYITLFHDADRRRVLFGTPGRDGATFERFCEDLASHGGSPEAIEAVSMDFSGAFQAAAAKHLPGARRCLDPFHLVKLANAALDEVRRAEVKQEASLRGVRWGTLKDAHDWTGPQLVKMHWLQRSGLKTARAWRLKERLREILRRGREGAFPLEALRSWVSWARRCRLGPFKRLGATVRDHLEAICEGYRLGLSNGTAESLNATVQAAIVRARGFRTQRNLMSVIYLVAGKLTHLPAPPFANASITT